MADDSTKLVIEIQTILRNLDRTLAGLKKVEQQLKSVASVKPNTTAFASTSAAAQRSGRAQVDQARKTAREIERINAQTAKQAAQQEAIRARAARTISIIQQREAKRGADAFIKSMKASDAAAAATNARIQSLGNSLRSLGQGAASVGFGLTAGLSVPLVAFGKSALDAAVTIDSLKRGLTAIVGSADEAGTQLARLTEIAKLPGIGFEEAIQGSIRLQAVGFSAADAEKALIQFSNAVALTGGGREELARITVQLGQLAAKGKVLSQDLRPIIEAAPAVGRALKQAFGTVNADDIAELTGSSQEFLKVLTAELERLPRAAAGARNTFENFRDEVFRASAAVGNALIPVLTRLIEVAGPIITRLADGFSKLPASLQTIAVLGGAATAAIGPLLIAFGLLTTGVGRLVVGLTQLSSLGLLPSVAALRTFNATASITIARLLGLRAATVAAAGPWIALAAAVGTILVAFKLLNQEQEEAVAVDLKSAKARADRIKSIEKEIKFLEQISRHKFILKSEEADLAQLYASASDEIKGRVALIDDERGKILALLDAKRQQLKLDQEAANATAARLIANFTIALDKQTKAQQALNAAKEAGVGVQQRRDIRRLAGITQDSVTILGAQRKAALEAAAALKSMGESEDEIRDAADAILQLSRTTGISVDKLLEQGKAANLSEDQVQRLRRAIEDLAQENRDAAPALDEFTRSINAQNKALLASGEVIDNIVKARKARLSAAVTLAKEASDSFEGAVKFMEAFLKANLQLRLDVAKEAQLAGKTFDEFVREALGEKADTKGTALRNAQEALADASAKVSQESAERLIAIEKSKNDELLRENETRFRKELISYREFIEERGRLQQLELQGEIDRQRALAETAADDAARQAARAGVTTGAERTRALAAEQTSRAKQIEAEIRILDLQSRQQDVVADTANELRQFSKDRERDFRELKRELDEILGKERQAGEAAVDERFRDTLRDLNNELLRSSRLFSESTDTAARQQATADVERINNQIEIINNFKKQLNAVVALRAAQEQVTRIEERQSNLERDIAFQVEFRGLSERDAVNKRLEGERLVRAEIEKQQAALKEVILTLKRLGIEVPQGLREGLERFKVAAKGLGESPFSEQFKLAEIDLGKTQDLLAAKVHGVELAVRSRALAEVQGRQAVRRFNNEYIEQLEREVQILEEIAAKSNDASLQRQAQSARQTVNEIRAAADEMENFGQQLQSVAIDSFADSLSQLFKDLRDNTQSATEDIINFFNNILTRVNDFIAENLARKIAESLFPDADGEGGFLSSIKGLFGGDATGAASLTAASVTLTTSITAAATTFAAIVTAAGATFAATINTSSLLSAGSSAGFLGGFATGDMIPAAPKGKIIRVAEGGYDEAVLTTDPKHSIRQAQILREFLKQTRGLYGRFHGDFAEGGIISARDAEANLLASLPSRSSLASLVPTAGLAGGPSVPTVNFRNINLLDRREMVRGHLRSAEGAHDILNVISENADEIGRRIRIR